MFFLDTDKAVPVFLAWGLKNTCLVCSLAENVMSYSKKRKRGKKTKIEASLAQQTLLWKAQIMQWSFQLVSPLLIVLQE